MSVRQIRREAEAARPYRQEWDTRDNAESRLPDGEIVELGGLVLAEVFTPSTVGRLFEALEEREAANPYDSNDRAAHVRRSRASTVRGWSDLGMVRRPGKRTFANFGVTDPKLPLGVDAAFLSVSTVTASVAIVTATFALEPGFLDMGAHLATDHRTTAGNVKVIIRGRLGKFRARIPWSRPKAHRTSYAVHDVWRLKERAIEDAIRDIEDRCGEWFYDLFPGRLSKLTRDQRAHARIIFTELARPFESTTPRTAFDAAGIGTSWGVFAGSETRNAGWRLSTGSPSFGSPDEYIWTFAARRSDVEYEMTQGKPDGSNWAVVQRFADVQGPLVALRALQVVLQSYAKDLADMRDRGDRTRRFTRTVREARTMNTYLLTTGLDLSSVTSDVGILTKHIDSFRWNVPEYRVELQNIEGEENQRDDGALVPLMRDMMRRQAKQLSRASTDTDRNLRASAELQQAIANTRMQRFVLALTVVAVVVAVVALFAGGSS